MGPSVLGEGRSDPVVVATAQLQPQGLVTHCLEPGLAGAGPASLTGTSSKAMSVTLLWGQLCQALFRRKARALVCRPSRATNLRNVQP